MGRYVAQRLVGSIVVFFVVASLVFGMIQLAPGDAVDILVGRDRDPATLAAVRHEFGLDRPFPVRWGKYLLNIVEGDLGKSLFTGRPVTRTIIQRAGPTLELTLLAVLWSSVLALVFGVVAAARRGKATDGAIRLTTIAGISLPSFWVGLMLLLIFGLYIPGILPAGGWVSLVNDPVGNLHHAILPSLVLGGANLALVTRVLRVSMLDALARDYVRFGRAMGLREGIVLRRLALPNAIIPTATVIGLAAGSLIGGSVITEVVFSIPGVGQMMVDAFRKQDYPVGVGGALFVALAFVVMNFTVDILYAFANPQIRQLFMRAERGTNG